MQGDLPADSRQENNAQRSADRCVFTGKGQLARYLVDSKRGDLVAALIARI